MSVTMANSSVLKSGNPTMVRGRSLASPSLPALRQAVNAKRVAHAVRVQTTMGATGKTCDLPPSTRQHKTRRASQMRLGLRGATRASKSSFFIHFSTPQFLSSWLSLDNTLFRIPPPITGTM
eukprot:1185285-Prorocentrum_minimum.AAC.1